MELDNNNLQSCTKTKSESVHNNLQMCESERRHHLGGTRGSHERCF